MKVDVSFFTEHHRP